MLRLQMCSTTLSNCTLGKDDTDQLFWKWQENRSPHILGAYGVQNTRGEGMGIFLYFLLIVRTNPVLYIDHHLTESLS